MRNTFSTARSAYSFESGVACAEALLARRPRPTAIFASNDEMAVGLYKAAYRFNISVPEELSVIGFDDSPVSTRLSPALTTIHLPIRHIARLAASKLIPSGSRDQAEAGSTSRIVPHLVVRESTQPPPR
jgi:LacI family transcriptional regulator